MSFRKIILTSTLLATVITAGYGQSISWASKLLGFSSERRPGQYGQQYRASQLLGPPSKLPVPGDSPCAWSPAEPDNNAEEWVKVAFQKPVRAKQVFIGENFNPGALTKVYLYDITGKEYEIATTAQLRRGFETGRLLTLRPSLGDVEISSLKIVMNPSLVAGYNQIDAIGITDSEAPFLLEVEVSAEMPSDITKNALSRAINSKWRENAPVVSPDGATLYFTREHPDNIGGTEKQNVWFSNRLPNGDWTPAKNIGAPINNKGDNAVLGISGSGKTLYLLNSYKPDGTMLEGFSKSTLGKSGWSFPATFLIEDHYNDFQPKNTEMTISPSEDVIILSVQRRDTQGGKDLYVSFKKAAGTWSAPINLGSVVNTADYEGAPFLASDNKTLYFTSMGHRGYGSGDIFVSRRLDESWLKWSKPLNLGPVINSSGWDSFFTIPASGDYAFMSSYNPANQSDDLFRIPMYPAISPEMLLTINGKLVSSETGQAIAGKILLKGEDGKNNLSEVTVDPETGEFKILVPYDSTFTISVTSNGFFSFEEELRYVKSSNNHQAIKNISLFPIKSGQQLTLKQVRFAQSSAKLEKKSFRELIELARVMKKYPTMEILLEGHTDNQGDFNKNLALSEERVESVKQFLLSEGVLAERIQLKAWGPSRPLVNNLTEESRIQNRRVELTILKI